MCIRDRSKRSSSSTCKNTLYLYYAITELRWENEKKEEERRKKERTKERKKDNADTIIVIIITTTTEKIYGNSLPLRGHIMHQLIKVEKWAI